MTTETCSVETIRDYLLGRLAESETERLDELSVTDAGWADRIRAVEHDLLDGFARGELQGALLEQFRSTYLTTPRRLEATRFAEALQSLDVPSARARSSPDGPERTPLVREKWGGRQLLALAAAVALLATASVWLALDNRTLRARVTSAESTRDQLQRDRQLREAEARRTPAPVPPPAGLAPSPLTVATLVLAPPLRSARQLPAVALADGRGDLAVRLDLEPVDYPTYDVALVASSGDRVVWRTDRLIARTASARRFLDLRVPTTVLSPQDYLIRVSGVPARGAPEIAGEYRFSVVR